MQIRSAEQCLLAAQEVLESIRAGVAGFGDYFPHYDHSIDLTLRKTGQQWPDLFKSLVFSPESYKLCVDSNNRKLRKSTYSKKVLKLNKYIL